MRRIAIGLRSLVLVLIALALGRSPDGAISDRLTVIYLLDQSLSIPAEQRRAMVEYVNAAAEEHRKRRRPAGVIVFGARRLSSFRLFPTRCI